MSGGSGWVDELNISFEYDLIFHYAHCPIPLHFVIFPFDRLSSHDVDLPNIYEFENF